MAAAQGGWYLLVVKRNQDSLLANLERLEDELGCDVLMLSIMAVNNETGVVQDWQEIDTLAGRTIVHINMAQALGKLPKLPMRPGRRERRP